MNVLVTGCDGYLGSLVAPVLMQRGHRVVGVDTGFYKDGWLCRGPSQTPVTFTRDVRHLTAGDLEGIDAVVHMAELSNDPVGQLSPATTHAINHRGSVRLAELAKSAGATRFVYMSSCSVYGVANDGLVTEESPTNPQTAYATCKTLVEADLKRLADARFSPTVLRNATAFGASPRMRFDVVLNNLAGLAWTSGRVAMSSDGTPWRPLVHVLDIAEAICTCLDAPRDLVHNEVFNVGDTGQNYRIRQIAETIAEVFEGCQITFGPETGDTRSYRVSFDKIHERLPGFRCIWDAERGARQLREMFASIQLDTALFEHRAFTRLAQIQHLLRTGQIDEELFWTDGSHALAAEVIELDAAPEREGLLQSLPR